MEFTYRESSAAGYVRHADPIKQVVVYSQDCYWRQGMQALFHSLLPADAVPVMVSSLAEVVREVKQSKLPVLVIYAYSYGVASLHGALSIFKQVADLSPFCRQVVITDELRPLFAAMANRIPSLTMLDARMACEPLGQVLLSLLDSSRHGAVCSPSLPQADINLSSRQRGVLRLLQQGVPQQQIARRLQIHEKTVSCHKVDLLKRLQIRGGRELVLLFSLTEEFFRLIIGDPLPLPCPKPQVHHVAHFHPGWRNAER